ncbi:MAG: cytochrome c biogenesis protein CcsA [Deltaproteobacteria bacterium]|nr:cytochrome c biogenesis protein CcsA [Deltaproteobacteria bacterium]
MPKVLLEVAAAVYLAAAVVAGLQLVRPRPRGDSLVRGTFLAAILAHAVALGGRTVEVHSFPIASAPDALSFFAALVGLTALVVSFRPKGEGGVPHVATLAAPIVFALMVTAAFFDFPMVQPLDVGLVVHIVLALFADAAFLVAGLVAVVYLVQESRLKRKKTGNKAPTALHDLPPLDVMDRVSVLLFKAGFPMLTIAISMGLLYNKKVFGEFWTWDPRNVVHLMVWVLYAVMLYARLVTGWHGKKAAFLMLVGVGAILVGFVGLGLAGGRSHGRALSAAAPLEVVR